LLGWTNPDLRSGGDPSVVKTLEEARGLVVNMVECDKPIISAINGPAAGAGLAVALLSDISIIGEDVQVTDGHVKIGLTAGDHAAIIWPILCGMAKAKHLLLTADRIDGREAERIGLVSKAVAREEVLTEALRLADQLARGPQYALRWTKHALNSWLRMAMPSFEVSLGLEDWAGTGVCAGSFGAPPEASADFSWSRRSAQLFELPHDSAQT
jgi:enoyl-CoA hydratase